ncbi:MAG TPA: hypothetical protein VGC45_14070 [Gryllotalpicola sp.]
MIEVRTDLPGGGDAAYVTWARVVAPADSEVEYVHIYVDTAIEASRPSRWWGRAWVSEAAPDTQAEPRRAHRPELRLIGQFELALERPDEPVAPAGWAASKPKAPTVPLLALIDGETVPVELDTAGHAGLPVLTAPGGWPARWSQRGYFLHPFDADHPDPTAGPVDVELFRTQGEPAAVRRRVLGREIEPYRVITVRPRDAGQSEQGPWRAQ